MRTAVGKNRPTYLVCHYGKHEFGDDRCHYLEFGPAEYVAQPGGEYVSSILYCHPSGGGDPDGYPTDPGDPDNYPNNGSDDPPTDESSPITCDPSGPPCIEEYSVANECKKIKDLILKYPQYKADLVQLATKTSDTVEHGIFIDESNSATKTIPVGNNGKIDLTNNPAQPYVSLSHTHNSPANATYSVNSWDDLAWLARVYENGKLNKSEFVAFLATANGTYYAITIKSGRKLTDYFYFPTEVGKDSNISKFLELNAVAKDYYKNKNSYIRVANATNDNNLLNFLKLLETKNMGLDVFETNANFDNFEHVSLSDNALNIIKKNCNL